MYLFRVFMIIVNDGTQTFRVSAPFALDVQVQGAFRGWNPGTHLYPEGNGYSNVHVAEAAVGQQYNQRITTPASRAVLTLLSARRGNDPASQRPPCCLVW